MFLPERRWSNRLRSPHRIPQAAHPPQPALVSARSCDRAASPARRPVCPPRSDQSRHPGNTLFIRTADEDSLGQLSITERVKSYPEIPGRNRGCVAYVRDDAAGEVPGLAHEGVHHLAVRARRHSVHSLTNTRTRCWRRCGGCDRSQPWFQSQQPAKHPQEPSTSVRLQSRHRDAKP